MMPRDNGGMPTKDTSNKATYLSIAFICIMGALIYFLG